VTSGWMQELEPVVSALGRTLVDFLWQGVLIAAVYAVARTLWRSPRARLLAGHIALLSLALAPLFTLSTQLANPHAAAASAMAGGYLPETVRVWADFDAQTSVLRWQYWLVAAWAAGVALLSLRLWTQWRSLRRLCREALPLDAIWQQRFAALKTRLGVRWRVRLRAGARIAAPMLVGVLRPTILLPSSLVARLPIDQMELVLLHELAHLRRFDPLLNLLQTAIVTLLFYHPAVHWISRRVHEDRELCCDEDVVASGGDRLRYARVLLTLAEEGWPGAPATALAASGGALLQRVQHIVDVPSSRGVNAQGIVLLALASLLALVWWLPARERELPRWFLSGAALVPNNLLSAPFAELLVSDIATLEVLRVQPVLPSGTATESEAKSIATLALPRAFPPLAIERLVPAPDLREGRPDGFALPAAVEVGSGEWLDASRRPRLPETVVEGAVQPAPRVRIEPVYPADARERGEQGWVELSYRIGADGRVEDLAIDRAVPSIAFERAARDALRQWRFAPTDADGRVLRVRFDFVLTPGAVEAAAGTAKAIGPAHAAPAEVDARCKPRTGSRLCPTIRDSIRQLSPR